MSHCLIAFGFDIFVCVFVKNVVNFIFIINHLVLFNKFNYFKTKLKKPSTIAYFQWKQGRVR